MRRWRCSWVLCSITDRMVSRTVADLQGSWRHHRVEALAPRRQSDVRQSGSPGLQHRDTVDLSSQETERRLGDPECTKAMEYVRSADFFPRKAHFRT
ncbi:hypothetical protein GCM10010206_17470 [Streptomyces cinerochromogenes]|nr:hypothetical protein GCM10010206_17470 [Streptomyces cinerochromogenes]